MQNVSNAYLQAMTAKTRNVRIRVEMAWDGQNWTDESQNVISFRVSRNLEAFGIDLLPTGTIDAGHIVLRNRAWRYSLYRQDGDNSIRSYISGAYGVTGIPVRIFVGFELANGSVEFCRLFTGFLYNLTEQPQAKTVQLQLRDAAWLLHQKRLSTIVYKDKPIHELLTIYANLAGWPSGQFISENSCFVIPLAWLDDDAVFQEMAQLAASSGGKLFCDALGNLRYEEASSWLNRGVVFTFDADDLMDLPPTTHVDTLASTIVVEYSPRFVGAEGVLYYLNEEHVIRPGETKTIELRLSQPAAEIFPLSSSDYYFDNGAGRSLNDRITIAMTAYAQRVNLSITNQHDSYAAFSRFLQLRGRPILGRPSEQISLQTSSQARIERTRSVRGAFYVQTKQQASFLAQLLKDRYKSIMPIWQIRNAPGIPPLELGDKIQIRDNRATTQFRVGYIFAIESVFNLNSSAPVFTQDITVIDETPLFVSGNYFRIGQSSLGSAVSWY